MVRVMKLALANYPENKDLFRYNTVTPAPTALTVPVVPLVQSASSRCLASAQGPKNKNQSVLNFTRMREKFDFGLVYHLALVWRRDGDPNSKLKDLIVKEVDELRKDRIAVKMLGHMKENYNLEDLELEVMKLLKQYHDNCKLYFPNILHLSMPKYTCNH